MATKNSKSKKIAKKSTKAPKKAIVRAKDVKSAVLKATGNRNNGVIVTSKTKKKPSKIVRVNESDEIIELPKKAKKTNVRTKKNTSVRKKVEEEKDLVSLSLSDEVKSNDLIQNENEVETKNVDTVTDVVDVSDTLKQDESVAVKNEEEKTENIVEEVKVDETSTNDEYVATSDKKIIDEKKLKKRYLLGKRKIRWDCVIFNAILILTFAFLILALFRIEVLKGSTILFIGSLIMFLMIIAISYNKYVSGKVFTLILCVGMGFTIYRLQYTYDFIHNLNSSNYEYRTYYVISLDTNINRSIYNINGKRVGMLKDNNTNIRRILNTKLDNVSYVYYEDADKLFEAFYKQDVRAVVVGENYYKYLLNNESTSNKKVKNLYEFKANAHK